MRQPPRLATWLLKSLVSSPTRDSLIGDLVEQHHRGRSSVWYWRQAFVAVLFDIFSEVREHKILAIRAVAVGLVVLQLLAWATAPISTWMVQSMWNWTVEHDFDALRALLFGRNAWPVGIVTLSLSWPAVGYIVTRTHRPHGMAMVFAFLLGHLVISFGLVAWFFGVAASRPGPPLTDMLAATGSWFVIKALFTIAGGMCGAGFRNDATSHALPT